MCAQNLRENVCLKQKKSAQSQVKDAGNQWEEMQTRREPSSSLQPFCVRRDPAFADVPHIRAHTAAHTNAQRSSCSPLSRDSQPSSSLICRPPRSTLHFYFLLSITLSHSNAALIYALCEVRRVCVSWLLHLWAVMRTVWVTWPPSGGLVPSNHAEIFQLELLCPSEEWDAAHKCCMSCVLCCTAAVWMNDALFVL